jgi:histidine triad (HIT) family protein
MDNCIFCKIIAGDVPSHTVYEDEGFKAFLDINPLEKGHTLIIPKRHYRFVWDVPNIGEYYTVVGMIANGLRKAFDTDWVTSMVVGDEVPHAHVSLVPRKGGMGGKKQPVGANRKSPLEDEKRGVADLIREQLK